MDSLLKRNKKINQKDLDLEKQIEEDLKNYKITIDEKLKLLLL